MTSEHFHFYNNLDLLFIKLLLIKNFKFKNSLIIIKILKIIIIVIIILINKIVLKSFLIIIIMIIKVYLNFISFLH